MIYFLDAVDTLPEHWSLNALHHLEHTATLRHKNKTPFDSLNFEMLVLKAGSLEPSVQENDRQKQYNCKGQKANRK